MSEFAIYVYETKCRRCGALVEWFFSDANLFSKFEFDKAMIDYISFPRLFDCEKCKKKTVQDVVSYEIKEKIKFITK